MIKRISAILLALVWALALAACGAGPAADSPVHSPAGKAVSDAPGQSLGPGPAAQTERPASQAAGSQLPESGAPSPSVAEDGWYSSKDEVALYLHLYGRLPGNYVTKREAEDAGWSGGSVERYTGEGTAIGGSRFGNYEGLLPEAEGRSYQECDIDTVGAPSRGAKRIVYSNDGLIYYTGDHYESFELLYGEP